MHCYRCDAVKIMGGNIMGKYPKDSSGNTYCARVCERIMEELQVSYATSLRYYKGIGRTANSVAVKKIVETIKLNTK